ncbi:hypothetical protein J7T55_003090 [Diaporthe amygdali]|uniref:uncharacterized protein n=1 Tax=Phomopsis amygdali TaxID=1214568 RepID=UPI0022FF12D1|nr:uncharacterized protein J7T55_003090 [Diaporthe amygdali]KAJ0122576.1 hypothetical protein J7T55_003090 [Diaporthe amygdali]
MIAAILRVSMVLLGGNGGTAAIWSCREDFVAICVGQAPILRPILTKRFWTGEMSYGHSQHTKSTLPNQSGNDAFEMNTARKANLHGSKHDMSRKGNDVTIFSTHGRDSDGESTDRIIDGGIVVNTWVGVQSETAAHGQAELVGPNSSDRDVRHS